MACTSLVALPRACGAEGIVAGVQELYIISYADLAPASGVAGTPVYTVTTGGVISDIGLDASKKYVQVGLLKQTSGFKETLAKNTQNGTAVWNQELPVTLADLTSENRVFINSVLNQPVSIMVKTFSGKYFVAGLNGQFEVSAGEGGTGTAITDLMGYTLTFSGFDTLPISMVDASLIAELI
jgi:hypothetical protein